MVRSRTLNVGIPALPSPEEALAVLRRIINAWELDRFDAMALVGSTSVDFATIEWTEDRLLRRISDRIGKSTPRIKSKDSCRPLDRHPEPRAVLRWKFTTSSTNWGPT